MNIFPSIMYDKIFLNKELLMEDLRPFWTLHFKASPFFLTANERNCLYTFFCSTCCKKYFRVKRLWKETLLQKITALFTSHFLIPAELRRFLRQTKSDAKWYIQNILTIIPKNLNSKSSMVEGEIRGETDPLKTDKRQNLKTGSDVINEKSPIRFI